MKEEMNGRHIALDTIEMTVRNDESNLRKRENREEHEPTRMDIKEYKEAGIKEFVFDFVKSSTIHGMRHTTESQTFIIRRYIWWIILLGCGCIFGIQVSLSAKHYLSRPMSVDVRINYNDSVTFPAVTVCNTNSFSLTKAYSEGFYDLIKSIYGADGLTLDISLLRSSNISLEKLYVETAQTQDEFLISCIWDGSPCRPGDFVRSFTDFGVCYTFNSVQKDSQLHKAHSTGTGGGLRLLLNLEQYQYMDGPNEGAGLRVHVHDNEGQVSIKDRGLAVPLGAHAFVSTRLIVANNQKPDYGVCNDSVVLDYFKHYSIENCYTDCVQRYVMDKCGCRHYYMPDVNGNSAVCSLIQYQRCLQGALVTFFSFRDKCLCPVPCKQQMYDTTISHATQSNFDKDSLLKMYKTGKWPNLQKTYVQAREIRHRVDETLVKDHRRIAEKYHSDVTSFEQDAMNIASILPTIKHSIDGVFDDIFQRMEFHFKRILQDISKSIQYNLIKQYDNFKEQTFDNLMDDFSGLVFVINHTLSSSINKTYQYRMLNYLPIQITLLNKQDVVRNSRKKMKAVNLAFGRVKRLDKEPYISYKRWYDDAMQSSALLNSDKSNRRALHNAIMDGLYMMEYGIEVFLEVGDKFLDSGQLDVQLLEAGGSYFTRGGDIVTQKLMRYYKEVITLPERLIQERMFELQRYNESVIGSHESINRKFLGINFLTDNKIPSLLRNALELDHHSKAYHMNEGKNKTKLANIITSKESQTTFLTLQQHIRNLQRGIKNIQRDLSSQILLYENVWKFMKFDPYTMNYYYQINEDRIEFQTAQEGGLRHLRLIQYFAYLVMYKYNYTELEQATLAGNLSRQELMELVPNFDLYRLKISQVIRDVNDFFTNTSMMLDVTSHLSESFTQLYGSYHDYKSQMQQYLDGNEIDTDFFLDNFMSVDIFMKELRYEEVNQQKAYSILQLLGDIGGSMGLFVGGSVLSLIEILDMCMLYCIYKHKHKTQ